MGCTLFFLYAACAKLRRSFESGRSMARSTLPSSHFNRERAAAAWRDFQATKIYDVLAAAPLILIFGMSGAHLAGELWTTLLEAKMASFDAIFAVSLLRQLVALVLVILLMTFLIIRNPAKAKAKGLMPRFAAFAGTYLGVVVVWLPAQPMTLAGSLLSLALMLSGAAFSIFSITHLGRSFSVMAEARRLVTDGPYARVRHPLYLGEAISFLGLTLQYLSPLALAIFVVQIGFQLVRMRNEEKVLAGLFPEYEAYRVRTARVLPGLY
jgi:protein-S-isoprenylcysteine O-methyltransferase Ste14